MNARSVIIRPIVSEKSYALLAAKGQPKPAQAQAKAEKGKK